MACYYATVDDTNPGSLRQTLHAVIDDARWRWQRWWGLPPCGLQIGVVT